VQACRGQTSEKILKGEGGSRNMRLEIRETLKARDNGAERKRIDSLLSAMRKLK